MSESPKIPNGLQQHVLYTMDGRSWIETLPSQRVASPFFKHMLKKGLVRVIDQAALATFVATL